MVTPSSSSALGVAPPTPAAPKPAPTPVLPKPDAETLAAARAQQEFALALYRELAALADANGEPARTNFVFSPWSVANSLGLLASGARGATATELIQALGFPAGTAPEELPAAYYKLYLRVGEIARSGHLTLLSAGGLWVQMNTPFQAAFLDNARHSFGTSVFPQDFSGNPESGAARINEWLNEKTREAFPRLVPAGSLTRQTTLVAAHVVQLDALWLEPLTVERRPNTPFFRPGQPPRFPIYLKSAAASTTDDGSVAAVRLAYRNPALEFIALLPAEQAGLTTLERTLNAAQLAQLLAGLSAGGEVWVPKFSFNVSFSIIPGLERLGLKRALQSGVADFRGITETPPPYLSVMRHGAKFEFHEMGTAATAATYDLMAPFGEGPPRPIRLDRPFIFMVRDRATGMIMFLGRLADPGG